jgi:hypothetical protein
MKRERAQGSGAEWGLKLASVAEESFCSVWPVGGGKEAVAPG